MPKTALIPDVTGQDGSYLARLVAKMVGFDGELAFDASKPDGTPRKLLDVTRLNQMGWTSQISLRDGLKASYADFLLTSVAAQ